MNKKTNIIYHDLMFTFKNCKMNVICDEEFFCKEDIEKINNIVKIFSKEICIDKSYVHFENTHYESTFILESGWKDLCELVLKTHYGDKCTDIEHAIMLESYKLLIIYYLYHILQLMSYDTEYIYIDMKENSKFMSIVEIDDSDYVLSYPGKWQKWQ